MRSELLARIQADPFMALGAFFLLRFALWSYVERKSPRYQVSSRKVLFADLGTSLFLFFVTIPLCDRLVVGLLPGFSLPQGSLALPLWLRIALYLVLADLGHYWMHRLMHTRLLWRIHKWHHVPTHMSWLAGNRTSFLDRLVTSLPYFFFWPILHMSPWWTGTLLLMFAGIKNDWMHLNTRFSLRFLEPFVVTPHYHHVHHSDAIEHNTKNLAALFPWWDHMFGTYSKPDARGLSFGIGEKVKALRLIVGV